MKKESQLHHAPSQTNPDIYATRFAFGPRFGLEGHSYHQWGINLTLSGHCLWQTEAGEVPVAPGDVLINRPYTWRSWRVYTPDPVPAKGCKKQAEPGWECAYAHFYPRPHWHEWLDSWEYSGGFALIPLSHHPDQQLAREFLAMANLFQSGGPLRDQRTLVALETVLLTILEHTVKSRLGLDARLKEVLEFMHAQYSQPLNVPKLAQRAELSPSHFAHLFTAALGETPGEYLERIRLARAAEMLRFSTHKIADIALACGFTDASYFALRFRTNFGQPPSAYRAASRP